jgi:hypothetical protein
VLKNRGIMKVSNNFRIKYILCYVILQFYSSGFFRRLSINFCRVFSYWVSLHNYIIALLYLSVILVL